MADGGVSQRWVKMRIVCLAALSGATVTDSGSWWD